MTQPKAKIAVTIDPEVLARVKSAVKAGPLRSVSAYVQHAVVQQLAAEASFECWLVEALQETGGPPTARERAEARRILGHTAA